MAKNAQSAEKVISSRTKRKKIRGTETDEPDRKLAQDHHLCGSLAADIKRKIRGFDSLELPLHLLSFAVSSPWRSVEPYGGWSDSAGTVGGGGTEPGSVWPPPRCPAGWTMWHSICLWRCLERFYSKGVCRECGLQTVTRTRRRNDWTRTQFDVDLESHMHCANVCPVTCIT